MTLLSQITERTNLDVVVMIKHRTAEEVVIEASITHFKETEGKASVVKKITVLGAGASVDEAQDAALSKAVTLLGGFNVQN